MAITTYAGWLAAQRNFLSKNAGTWQWKPVSTSGFTSLFARTGNTGSPVAPAAAAVPARDIAGAMWQDNAPSGKQLYIGVADIQTSGFTYISGLMVLDRLSHQGGLNGTVVGLQPTNLPTAALTRYTSGVGVIACVEIYSQIGATATTALVSYVNQAGATVNSPLFTIGGSTFREGSRLIPIPLAAGDYGVRAVNSISLTASTLTIGNFGITLVKPILIIPTNMSDSIIDMLIGGGCFTERILDEACLMQAHISSNTSGFNGTFTFIEA